jgi:hypothetical protein
MFYLTFRMLYLVNYFVDLAARMFQIYYLKMTL